MVDTYKPELGQMAFGNPSQEFEIPHEKFVESSLYALSSQFNINSPSYGCEIDNEVFEIHMYYWGECECGYDEKESKWHEDNEHEYECYQKELDREQEKVGIHRNDFVVNQTKKGHELRQKKEDEIYKRLCAKHSLSYPDGCAVHCTCGYKKNWYEFLAGNDHDPKCGTILPNFRHKESGIEISWYKYIGRGMSINREVTKGELTKVFQDCNRWVLDRKNNET